MATFHAVVHIMPRKEILDPQGKATLLGLHNLGFASVSDLRIGKRVELRIEAAGEAEARAQVGEACRRLLANTITEQFHFELTPA